MSDLHHALLLIGPSDEAVAYVHSLSSSLGISTVNNPDFIIFRFETFGIDEARYLSILSNNKAIRNKKIFLVLAGQLTIDAQNALLKTFEDPPSNTHFFIHVLEELQIIPTLRSRMRLIHLIPSHYQPKEAIRAAEEFIGLSLKERLEFAKGLNFNNRDLTEFLDGLIILLKSRGLHKVARKVYKIRNVTDRTTAGPRLALEHLALIVN